MTSKPGGRPVVRLAADANVLLSVAAGHAASKVMLNSFPVDVELVTTASVIAEIREYLPALAEQAGLDLARVEADFEALFLEIPVWSNDSDFEHAGIEWYTTARLLAKYGVFGN